MDERIIGVDWGERPELELTYPSFLDTDYVKLAHRLKRQQQAAERYRRKQRIKDRVITVAWGVCLVGFGVALIMWG